MAQYIIWVDGQPAIAHSIGNNPSVVWYDGQPNITHNSTVFEYSASGTLTASGISNTEWSNIVEVYVDPGATGAADGTSWTDAYTGLQAAETAEQRDLVTEEIRIRFNCRDTSGNGDTIAARFVSWTGDSEYYIIVQGDNYSGKWDDTKYVLRDTDIAPSTASVLAIGESFTRVNNIQIEFDYSGSSNFHVFEAITIEGTQINGCIAKHIGTPTGSNRGFYLSGATTTNPTLISNCISYNAPDEGFYLSGENNSVYSYNNTAINCGIGFSTGLNDSVIYNSLVFNCTTAYSGTFIGGSNNAGDSTAGTPTGADTNFVDISGDTDGDIFVDYDNNDFHIQLGARIMGGGLDLSGDSNFPLLIDIEGDTRANWDIGADEKEANTIVRFVDTDTPGMTGDTGTGWANSYDRLAYWENAEGENLVANTRKHHVWCRASSGTGDTSAIAIATFVANSIYTLTVESAFSDVALKTGWDDNRYRITVTDGSCFTTQNQGVIVKNLQFESIYVSSNWFNVINLGFIGGNDVVEISGCRVRSSGAGNYRGINIDYNILNVNVYNNIIGPTTRDAFRINASESVNIYNNILYGSDSGIETTTLSNNVIIKNNVIFNNTDDVSDLASGTIIDYNASDDDDGTNNVAESSGDTFWTSDFVDAENGDFTLLNGSNLVDSGTNLSSMFTTDIEGDARIRWDIGVDEWEPKYTSDGTITISGDANTTVATVEAGQGAVDRGSNSIGYTYISKASASITGDCTRLAVYAECSASQAIKFAFYSNPGTGNRVTDVFVFDSGVGGNKIYEFNSGTDFTAFSVTSGWYLTCYIEGTQTFATSGGVGIWYQASDVIDAGATMTDGANFLDGLEASISSVSNYSYNASGEIALDGIADVEIEFTYSPTGTLNVEGTSSSAAEVHKYVDTAIGDSVGDSWGNAYSSLSAWHTNTTPIDLLLNNLHYYVHCRASNGDTDTLGVTIGDTWTGDSIYFLTIEVPQSERHSGVWDDTKYTLIPSSPRTNGTLTIGAQGIHIDGLQISSSSISNQNQGGIFLRNQTTSMYTKITNNIIRGIDDGGSNYVNGIQNSTTGDGILIITNNIIYDYTGSGTGTGAIGLWDANINNYLYNNTFYNNLYSVYQVLASGPAYIYNNISQVSTNGFDFAANFYGLKNISDVVGDSTTGDTISYGLITFGDTSLYDYRLAGNDVVAINNGVDLSGDSIYSFNADIEGESRIGLWDIGADEQPEIIRYVNTASVGGNGTTNAESGATAAYASLSAWEAAEQTDLVTAGNWHHVYVTTGSGTTADTIAVTINGWTTGAANYILIEAASGDEALKTGWDANRYRLSVTDAHCITVYEDYTRFSKLQIRSIYSATAGRSGIIFSAFNAANYHQVSNCRVRGDTNVSANGIGLNLNDSDTVIDVWNTIIEDWDTRAVYGWGVTVNLLNNIMYNCAQAGLWWRGAGTVTGKNNAIFATGNDIIDDGAGTLTLDYNASDDDDGTNNVAESSGDTYWTSDFVDAENGDFTLLAGSALRRAGDSDPSSGLFTDDIDGDSRYCWSVGVDEGIPTTRNVYIDTAIGDSIGDSWGNAYQSLSAAQNGEEEDISYSTGTDEIVIFNCRASTGIGDTIQVWVDGWTNTNYNYVKFKAAASDKAVKTGWDDTRYRLDVPDNEGFYLFRTYIWIEGIQIKLSQTGIETPAGIELHSTAIPSIGWVKVDSCYIQGDSSGDSYNLIGITTNTSGYIQVYNTIVNDIGQFNVNNVGINLPDGSNGEIYNCVITNASRAINDSSGTTVTIKNSALFNNNNDILNQGNTTISFCASDDYDGGDTVVSSSGDTYWTSDFVDAENGDFTLLAGSNLRRAGDSTIYLTDMDGDTWHTLKSVGVDETGTITTNVYIDTDTPGMTGDTGDSWGVAYNSLKIAHDTEVRDIRDATIGSDEIVVFNCRASSGTGDTNLSITIDNWNTRENNYVEFKAADSDRAGTSWDDTKYRFISLSSNGLLIHENYFRFNGIQLYKEASAASFNRPFHISGINEDPSISAYFRVDGCYFKGNFSGGSYSSEAIHFGWHATNGDGNWTGDIYNTIIEGFSEGDTISLLGIYNGGLFTTNIYNSVISNCGYGLQRNSGTINVYNSVVFNNIDDFNGSTSLVSAYYCASDDDYTGDNGTNNIAESSGDTFWTSDFVDAENGDFTLLNNSNLVGSGLSDPGSGLFNTDIEGDIRIRYDVGADEWEPKYTSDGTITLDGIAATEISSAGDSNYIYIPLGEEIIISANISYEAFYEYIHGPPVTGIVLDGIANTTQSGINEYISTGSITLDGNTATAQVGKVKSARICGDSDFNGRFHGWGIEIEIGGLTTGGSYEFGWGDSTSSLSNSTPTITLNVNTYTFNGSQIPTTDTMTIYGTKQIRQEYPGDSLNEETLTDSGVKLYIALSEYIYPDDTMTIDILDGFYNDNGDSVTGITGFSVNNDCTLTLPVPIANWSWPGYRTVGDSFQVRAVGFHRSAQDSEPLKYVKFIVQDESGDTITKVISESTIDDSMPDINKVIEYVATIDSIDTALFTDEDTLTCNFIAYPHRTDSTGSNVLYTNDGINLQPTPLYAPQTLLLDKVGDHGFTLVDAISGNDGTGTVYSSQTSAESGSAYLTIAAALTGLQTYHNANSGHNDAGGGIILLTGDTHNLNSSNGGATLSSWVTLKSMTGESSSTVNVVPTTTNSVFPQKMKLEDVSFTGGNYYTAGNSRYMWYNRVAFNTSGVVTMWQSPVSYVTYSTGTYSDAFVAFSSPANHIAIIRGCDMDIPHESYGYCNIGNNNVWTVDVNDGVDSVIPIGGIYAFNSMYDFDGRSINSLLRIWENTHGYAIVQNILESTSPDSDPIIQLGADQSTAELNHGILWHNTIIGERINIAYNDNGDTAPPRRYWSQKGNIVYQWNCKTDTFLTPNGLRTGNWSVMYGVGTFDDIRSDYLFRGEFDGIDTILISTLAMDYVNDLSGGDSFGVGNGDYHLGDSSVAINHVSNADKSLRWDIEGTLRGYNTTAGAFEFIYEYIPLGEEIVLSGIAATEAETTVDISYAPTGTLTLEGISQTNLDTINYINIPFGTITLDGKAITQIEGQNIYIATGIINVDGEANTEEFSNNFVTTTSGKIDILGQSETEFTSEYSHSASGTFLINGISETKIEFSYDWLGSLSIDGFANTDYTRDYSYNALGELTINGISDSEEYNDYSYNATGEIVTSGKSDVVLSSSTYIYTTKGTIILGGTVEASFGNEYIGTDGLTLNGIANIILGDYSYTYVPSGTLTISGLPQYAPSGWYHLSDGLITLSGIAQNIGSDFKFSYSPSGILMINGTSTTVLKAYITQFVDFPEDSGDTSGFWENRFSFTDLFSGKVSI